MQREELAASAQRLVEVFADHRLVDLSRRLEPGIPSYPTHPKYFQMPWRSMGDPAEMNQLVLGEHTGTHVDAPSHFVTEGDPARRHIDELVLETFCGRALTMSFGPFEGPNELVRLRDVQRWEDEQAEVRAGDIVLIDFRWAGRWAHVPQGFAFLEGWPGLARDAAEYLADRRVKAVGTDCVSLDPGDGGGGELAAHYTLLPAGILIMENVANLDQLPPVSFVMALPLPIANGTGSPVRAVALVPR
ncbi:MAG: arylformamidase [Solirubrobacteraceae bacterium]|nr:arylformamidase [Solirubrobacteraceae bacterium]